MKSYRWVIVSLLLPFVTADPVAGQEPAKGIQNKPAEVVFGSLLSRTPLDIDDNYPVVQGTIGPVGSLRFLIDTGAEYNLLDDGTLDRIGLKPTRTIKRATPSLAMPAEVPVVKVGSLSIGGLTFKGFEAGVVDLDRRMGRNDPVDGILTLEFFTDCLLTLDYIHKYVALSRGTLKPADGAEILDFKMTSGLPHINISIEGMTTPIGLATATEAEFTINEALSRDVLFTAPQIAQMKTRKFISDVDIKQPKLDGVMHIGKHQLLKVPVFRDDVGPCRIGHQLLRYFTVSFDQKEHRVRLTGPADEPFSTERRSRFGLVLTRAGNFVRVYHVYPGSPADGSPIAQGDEIWEIDHKRPGKYRDEEIVHMLSRRDSLLFKVDKGGAQLLVVLNAR